MAASAPERLRGRLVAYTTIRLDWDVPLQHPGSVKYYMVYYRAPNWNQYTRV